MNVIDMNVQEIAESYLSSLLELTSNNKALINVLTIVADENIDYGQTIVDTINQRIIEVDPDLKLPLLYLIDSILKNVGDKYVEYFMQSIVSTFVEAFEKVNVGIRKKLFALRGTWSEIFPRVILSTLDAKMNAIDANWLIAKTRFGERDEANEPDVKKIKLENVDMLFSKEDVDLRILQPKNLMTSNGILKAACNDIDSYGKSTEKGRKFEVLSASSFGEGIKQPHRVSHTVHRQKYVGAQQMKHLSAIKNCNWYPQTHPKDGLCETLKRGSRLRNIKRIYPWKKQVEMSTYSSVPFKSDQRPMNRVNKFINNQNDRQFPFVNQSFNRNHIQNSPDIASQYMSTVPDFNTSIFSNKKLTQVANHNKVNVIPEVSNKPVEINFQSLFQKLLQFGMINHVEEKPALNKPETLKKKNPSAVKALYTGWQCSSCGIRFPTEQTTEQRDHLDWHYQQNRNEKCDRLYIKCREWYHSAVDWVQIKETHLEEQNLVETKAKSPPTLKDESKPLTQNCIAAHDEHNEECDMCHDQFEMFYDDETDEWYLRNAIRKGENVYHPICYEDQ